MFRRFSRLLLLVPLLLHAVADDVREVALEFAGKPIPTQEWAGALMGSIECDENGGIYFRRAGGAPGTGSALEQPVVRVDHTGQVTEYPLKRVPDLPRDAVAFTFTVDRSGRVFQVVNAHDEEKKPQLYIVSFDRNGEFRWKAHLVNPSGALPTDYAPSSLIATPHGDFLLAGERHGVAFTDVFGSDGKLRTSHLTMNQETSKPPRLTLSGSSVRIGHDSSLHVLRLFDVQIAVFDASADLVRSMTLRPPFAGAQPQRLLFTGPRLLVAFQERLGPGEKDKLPKVVYTLYDTETAEAIVSYVVPPRSGILACADPQRLTFLRPGDDARFAIVYAPLK